jgi:hypothetical protein
MERQKFWLLISDKTVGVEAEYYETNKKNAYDRESPKAPGSHDGQKFH